MRKRFLILFGTSLALLSIAFVGTYQFARSHITRLPEVLASLLEQHGIDLKYQAAETSQSSLTVTLKRVSFEGPPLSHPLTAGTITIGIEPGLHLPPIVVFVNATELTVGERRMADASKSSREERPRSALSATESNAVGLLLRFVQFDVEIHDGALPDLGIRGASVKAHLTHLELGPAGKPTRVVLTHDIVNGTCEKAPWVDKLRWTGETFYDGKTIKAMHHSVVAGPFVLGLNGNYDLASEKWYFDLLTPSSEKNRVKLRAQGIGNNLSSINTDGAIRLPPLQLTVHQPGLNGSIELELDSEFSKDQTLSLKTIAKVDLTQAEIIRGDLFSKPKGVPLTLGFTLGGNDGRLALSQGEARLDALAVGLGGNILVGPPSKADLRLSLPATPLAGWERFFPKYVSLLKKFVDGRVSAKMDFELGEIDELQTSIRVHGDFKVVDGDLKTLRFSSQALGALRKIPGVSSQLMRADTDERFDSMEGRFDIGPEKITLSKVAILGPRFEATAGELTIDGDQNITGKILWQPKETLFSPRLFTLLRDPGTKRASFPISLGGSLISPSIFLDERTLLTRTRALAPRRIARQKRRFLSQSKSKTKGVF